MTAQFPQLCGATYKQTASDMVRDKIVSLIASGVLQLGDELPGERELAAMLLVSRETVRGAI
jgi:DNA-binding FadR family transcriptional regulator